MSETRGQVQNLLDRMVAEGTELGIQVAAYVDGKLALDLWAGTADEQTGRPVDRDTLFTVYSATKGVVATAVHILADRGLLDYESPIARYWPEFAANGKERTTLRHALSHQAGIPQLPAGTTPALMCDWDYMAAAIADLTPLWPAGSRTQYHGMTFGWILGEIVRRVDGRTIRQFVHDEIAQPLEIRDLNIGLPEADQGRVARLKAAAQDVGTIPVDHWNTSAQRAAIIPAAGGLFNAVSLARLYATLAGGGNLDGVQLLTPGRLAEATQQQTNPKDAAEIEMIFGLGYRLGGTVYSEASPMRSFSTRVSVFGHTGAGGAIGIADPERRFAIAVTKNLLRSAVPGTIFPTVTIVKAVRAALGVDE